MTERAADLDGEVRSPGEAEGPDSSPVTRRLRYDIVTHSPQETVAFGRELARIARPPCVLLMEGELGSGKTVLTKGIAAGLEAVNESEVTSPTFALVHEYTGRNRVYHVDLYRVESARELATLGLDDLINQPATVIVEWGEKFEAYAPLPYFKVRLQHQGNDDRRIVVEEVT